MPIAKPCGNFPSRQNGGVQSSFLTHTGSVGIKSSLLNIQLFPYRIIPRCRVYFTVHSTGLDVGVSVGALVGLRVGVSVGALVGLGVGVSVGALVGSQIGNSVPVLVCVFFQLPFQTQDAGAVVQ